MRSLALHCHHHKVLECLMPVSLCRKWFPVRNASPGVIEAPLFRDYQVPR